MNSRIFTMTKRILNLRKTNELKITCHTCNGIIKIGDIVVTKKNTAKNAKGVRHESCARRVGLIE